MKEEGPIDILCNCLHPDTLIRPFVWGSVKQLSWIWILWSESQEEIVNDWTLGKQPEQMMIVSRLL